MSETLDEELQEWLATPEGQEFLRAQNPSILFSILHSLMLILLGAFYCCSLILFWDGVHCLWQGLTFHPVRTTGISREQLRNLQAVVAYPVRIGPGPIQVRSTKEPSEPPTENPAPAPAN